MPFQLPISVVAPFTGFAMELPVFRVTLVPVFPQRVWVPEFLLAKRALDIRGSLKGLVFLVSRTIEMLYQLLISVVATLTYVAIPFPVFRVTFVPVSPQRVWLPEFLLAKGALEGALSGVRPNMRLEPVLTKANLLAELTNEAFACGMLGVVAPIESNTLLVMHILLGAVTGIFRYGKSGLLSVQWRISDAGTQRVFPTWFYRLRISDRHCL